MKNNLKQTIAMKKRIFSILAILGLLMSPLNAQILLMDPDEESSNIRVNSDDIGELPFFPYQGITIDQYAPLGEGLLLLGCLGGAYLLGKRRRKEGE